MFFTRSNRSILYLQANATDSYQSPHDAWQDVIATSVVRSYLALDSTAGAIDAGTESLAGVVTSYAVRMSLKRVSCGEIYSCADTERFYNSVLTCSFVFRQRLSDQKHVLQTLNQGSAVES